MNFVNSLDNRTISEFYLPSNCIYWCDYVTNNIFDEVLRWFIQEGQSVGHRFDALEKEQHNEFLKRNFLQLVNEKINESLFINEPYDLYFFIKKSIMTTLLEKDDIIGGYIIDLLNRDLDVIRKIYKLVVQRLREINIINNKVCEKLMEDLEYSIFRGVKIAIRTPDQEKLGTKFYSLLFNFNQFVKKILLFV